MVWVVKSLKTPSKTILMDYSNSISQVRFTAMSMCKGDDCIEVGDGYNVYGANGFVKTYIDKKQGLVYLSDGKFFWKSFSARSRNAVYELTKSGNIKRK